jgi:hypothetical protein
MTPTEPPLEGQDKGVGRAPVSPLSPSILAELYEKVDALQDMITCPTEQQAWKLLLETFIGAVGGHQAAFLTASAMVSNHFQCRAQYPHTVPTVIDDNDRKLLTDEQGENLWKELQTWPIIQVRHWAHSTPFTIDPPCAVLEKSLFWRSGSTEKGEQTARETLWAVLRYRRRLTGVVVVARIISDASEASTEGPGLFSVENKHAAQFLAARAAPILEAKLHTGQLERWENDLSHKNGATEVAECMLDRLL